MNAIALSLRDWTLRQLSAIFSLENCTRRPVSPCVHELDAQDQLDLARLVVSCEETVSIPAVKPAPARKLPAPRKAVKQDQLAHAREAHNAVHALVTREDLGAFTVEGYRG